MNVSVSALWPSRRASGAVVRTPSAAAGDLQLDMLSPPSQVRFTLRAYLFDNLTRQVLAWQEFDQRVAVTREDPYGSVLAANRAVHAVLASLVDFCNEAVARRPATMPAATPASGEGAKPVLP